MIDPERFRSELAAKGVDFYAGVPDSLLKSLCACLRDNVAPDHNIITANEGAAIALAAGYHLASGRIPVVYMQNSGLGNIVNPLLSLTDKEVYNIPALIIIGWRGEPGVHDEPQHVKQGKVTLPLLDAMILPYTILDDEPETASEQLTTALNYIQSTGESFALVVRKGTFAPYTAETPADDPQFPLSREEAIATLLDTMDPKSAIVSTTGMISREFFELREKRGEDHSHDFLTVGSMGHASQIALGIAIADPKLPVYCFDGDGAVIMHMGSMAITGSVHPGNMTHIVLNNGAHDSVGGQPTVGLRIDLPGIARACGYASALSVDTADGIRDALTRTDLPRPLLLEIKVRKGARKDLGRPTTTPIENKNAFINFIRNTD